MMDSKSRTRSVYIFVFERRKTGFGLGHWPYSGNTQPEASSACTLNARKSRRSASHADWTPLWVCYLWLTLVTLMSNFICVNGSLRFDPSSVTFCKVLLQSACLSKAYLRTGVLGPNARHLVACATPDDAREGAHGAPATGLRRHGSFHIPEPQRPPDRSSGNSEKFDIRGEPIDQDWCWKGGTQKNFRFHQWRRKILDRVPLWS